MPPLAPPLQAILDAEMAAGNAVAEASPWLPNCELFVLLRHSFSQMYPLATQLSYRHLNDPHYWLAGYDLDEGRQVLACGFTAR